jgi:pyruvate/2-oxoglutarate dehydrogenase complex dihydrolipoamide acyltransferase (E2) component
MQQNLIVPGLAENVHEADVAEVSVKPGDTIAAGDIVITLETDKAAMELPAEFGGKVTAVRVKAGDRVKEGDVIVVLETTAGAEPPPQESAAPAPAASAPEPKPAAAQTPNPRQRPLQRRLRRQAAPCSRSPARTWATARPPT